MKIGRRKTVLINPGFQVRFIFFMILTGMVTGSSLYFSCVYFFHRLKSMGERFGIPADNPFFVFISQQESLMNQIILVNSVVVLGVVILSGLIYSHRIAGSVHHMKGEMRRIQSTQDFTPLQFRKHDFFPELADEFNEMVRRLQKEERS